MQNLWKKYQIKLPWSFELTQAEWGGCCCEWKRAHTSCRLLRPDTPLQEPMRMWETKMQRETWSCGSNGVKMSRRCCRGNKEAVSESILVQGNPSAKPEYLWRERLHVNNTLSEIRWLTGFCLQEAFESELAGKTRGWVAVVWGLQTSDFRTLLPSSLLDEFCRNMNPDDASQSYPHHHQTEQVPWGGLMEEEVWGVRRKRVLQISEENSVTKQSNSKIYLFVS